MGKVLNIRVNYTWILVFALVTTIVTTQLIEGYGLWQRIALGLVVSLFLLVAAALRELVLNMIPSPRTIPARKMILFVFGGVYLDSQDEVSTTNLTLPYLARFLSNLAMAAIFYALYATFITANNMIMASVAEWLAYIYFLLFLLHFIPAFPLDGGQILRAVLWRSSGDYNRATGLASLIGWSVGMFFIFAGILVFIISREWIISSMIVVVGWIIEVAAGYTRREIMTRRILRDIRAGDIMTRDYPVLPQQVKFAQLFRDYILVKGWSYVVVADGTHLQGILTMDRIKSVPGKRWNSTTLGDVMVPSGQIRTAQIKQTADLLFEEMHRQNIDHIPVLDGDSLVGVVNRVALLGLVKTRIGLGY